MRCALTMIGRLSISLLSDVCNPISRRAVALHAHPRSIHAGFCQKPTPGTCAGTYVFREVEETTAAPGDDAGAGGGQTVTRSRFVISEKTLKPPTVAAPKSKAHRRQGIGASLYRLLTVPPLLSELAAAAHASRPVHFSLDVTYRCSCVLTHDSCCIRLSNNNSLSLTHSGLGQHTRKQRRGGCVLKICRCRRPRQLERGRAVPAVPRRRAAPRAVDLGRDGCQAGRGAPALQVRIVSCEGQSAVASNRVPSSEEVPPHAAAQDEQRYVPFCCHLVRAVCSLELTNRLPVLQACMCGRADWKLGIAQPRDGDGMGHERAAVGGLHWRKQGISVVTRRRVLRARATARVPRAQRRVQRRRRAAAHAAAEQQRRLLLCVRDGVKSDWRDKPQPQLRRAPLLHMLSPTGACLPSDDDAGKRQCVISRVFMPASNFVIELSRPPCVLNDDDGI